MKIRVNATIITDVEALKADKDLKHFKDYVICELLLSMKIII